MLVSLGLHLFPLLGDSTGLAGIASFWLAPSSAVDERQDVRVVRTPGEPADLDPTSPLPADHFIFMALALPLPALTFLGMAADMAPLPPLVALPMAIAPLPALPLYMVRPVTT